MAAAFSMPDKQKIFRFFLKGVDDAQKMKEWIKQNLLTVVLTAGLLIGISLLLYPSVANYWNSYRAAKTIMNYTETVSKMDRSEYKKILKNAKKYNSKLAKEGIKWRMTNAERVEYEKELSVDKSGIMGFVSLPKFHIRCPIYHGTSEEVLQTAIGHLEGSSLPIGGKSTHTMISGHRGLPSARLFTDLDKVKEGDTWTITVLNETITYECDQVRIVLPEDLSDLRIEKGKDLCTLITCTPYGVNTHRLLVRGHRVPNANGSADVTADAIQIEPIFIAPFLAGAMLLILLILLLISTRRAKRMGPEEYISKYFEEKGLKK